tara:strand:- start:11812 stop:12813 length:1002 start_codon:yes stop_codon:yes gene_type:complete
MENKVELKRVVMEVFGGCNYTCQMCPQTNPGRGKSFTRKMPISEFERILDQIVPKYGMPQINLEGSGEPTMAKDLPKYIEAVKKRNLKCFMYCNGARLNGQFMKDVVNAGIDFVRFSVIGYNRELYKKWMNIDNFNLILSNLTEIQSYVKSTNSGTQISTYHLITNNSKINEEIESYKKNVINVVKSVAYIWKMHNWSGNHDNINPREKTARRSCGRPFAPELTVRAGGSLGRTGAIVPCCQTLGPPNEEKSILGHLDKNSFEDIYFGEEYEKLRKAHENKEFDKIDYCKDCDFLYDDPEAVVWTNDKDHKLYNMLGTGEDFILTEYNNREQI